MNGSHFAPITSALLARKGDAMPSGLTKKPSLFWARDAVPPPPVDAPRAAAAPLPAPELPRAAPVAAPAVDLRTARAAPPAIETPRAASVAPVAPDQRAMSAPLPAAETPATVPPPPLVKPHKLMVALTPDEFERIGIAAVKKGVTRHQILRTALDLHMTRLGREYGGCGCMAGAPCHAGCGTP
jgi:hypothetical protein